MPNARSRSGSGQGRLQAAHPGIQKGDGPL